MDSGTNEVVAVSKNYQGFDESIGTDVGYSTVEIGFAPTDNLATFQNHFDEIMAIVVKHLAKDNALILGYGVQPITTPNKSLLANKGRYKIFERNSPNRSIDQKNGVDLHFFTSSCANQCHLDVSMNELVDATNIFNKLSPFAIAFFQNSPIWNGKLDEQWKASREMFWDWGWTNRLNQIGILPNINKIEDYLNILLSFKPLMIKRDGQFLEITSFETFAEFLNQKNCEAKDVNGNIVNITPELKDVCFQNGFAWFNARPSPSYGTLEFRPICQQLPGESLLLGAFALGIISNLDEAKKFTDQFTNDQIVKLRFETCRHGFDSELESNNFVEQLTNLLEISKEGLERRGKNEEKLLDVVFERLNKKQNPADEVIEVFKNGGIKSFLELASFKY